MSKKISALMLEVLFCPVLTWCIVACRPDDATEPEHQQRLADVPPVLEAPDQACVCISISWLLAQNAVHACWATVLSLFILAGGAAAGYAKVTLRHHTGSRVLLKPHLRCLQTPDRSCHCCRI